MRTRRTIGTVIPTRIAVLSGSVLMGCDQAVSLNLSPLVYALTFKELKVDKKNFVANLLF